MLVPVLRQAECFCLEQVNSTVSTVSFNRRPSLTLASLRYLPSPAGSVQDAAVTYKYHWDVVRSFSGRAINVTCSSSGSGTSSVAAGWRDVSFGCSNWKNGGGGISWLRLLRRVRLQQQQPHLSGSQCVFFSLGDIGIQQGHGPDGVLGASVVVGWLVR